MKAINSIILALFLSIPAWGACKSTNAGNEYLVSDEYTDWHDQSGIDWVIGWSQNAADSITGDVFMGVGHQGGNSDAGWNFAMLIHSNIGGATKWGFHEYGVGTNEFTGTDDFCASSNCTATRPSYYSMVAEKTSSDTRYRVDWVVQQDKGANGHNAWNQTFSQTYTNEHTGGTNGIETRLSNPGASNFANAWIYRGTLPDMLQRATVYGFYPWNADRFWFTPCRGGRLHLGEHPENWGSIAWTWSYSNANFQLTDSQPPATVFPLWMMQ